MTDSKGYKFLSGGGEMGKLIRTADWNQTNLSTPECWPQSLKTAVSIMLDTHFPMYIAWGTEFTQFYNDGYRPILGDTKHPAIGKSTKETFAEIWEIIGPMFEGVMEGTAVGVTDFLLPLNRYGYTEECYFIFSYSPIRDESGDVGGVLVTVTETTTRVIEERRLKTLRLMADYAADVKVPSEAWEKITKTIEENSYDIPFSLCYSISENGEANLEGSCRIPADKAITTIFTNGDSWNIGEVSSVGQPRVIDLKREPEFRAGHWNEPIKQAYVLPLMRPELNTPYGLLVLGINPRKTFDESYGVFLDLFSNHAATALRNAFMFEAERNRIESLMEIDKAKTTFFSNISHEFRTPLTLMLGPLEDLLNNGDQFTPRILENIHTTHRNAMRLLRLVNSLLDFSRIEAGRVQANYQKIEIGNFTRDLASNFRSTIENAGLKLLIECDAILQPVYVDKQMWEKIVFNLLSNAFKYTLKGSVQLIVAAEADHVVLKVRDTGIGIPAKELPRMFERFHRVKGNNGRTYEGSGIGLSLVAELVELHKGTINVTSEEGHGSEFIITIPFGKAHLTSGQVTEENSYDSDVVPELYISDITTTAEKEEKLAAAINPDKPVILVVDDNADMRGYICRLLQSSYTVVTANNGKEAFDIALKVGPDIVISDIMMPVMDGVELLKKLKSTQALATTPVVLLSARAGEESRIEGYDIGSDDYLVKPFSAKELLARVNAQLRIVRKRRHLESQLRNLFVQAPIAMCILRGPNMVVEIANDRILAIWRKNSDILNKPIFEAIPEARDQGYEELLNKVYESGIRYVAEELPLEIVKDGERQELYVKFVYEPLREEDGTISGIMVVADEITEQVNARKKIEESDKLVRNLIMQAPVAMAIYRGPKFIIEVANTKVLEFWDRKLEEVMFKPLFEALPDVKEQGFEEILNNILLTGNRFYAPEYQLSILRDGKLQYIYISFALEPMRDLCGNIDAIIVVANEITENVLARKKIEESEVRQKLAIEAAEMGAFELDVTTNFVICNQKMRELFGFNAEGQLFHEDFLGVIHPDDWEIREKAYTEMETTGILKYEMRLLRQDNTIRWVKINAKLFKSNEGTGAKIHGTALDFTEQNLATIELKESERKFRLLADFMPQQIWTANPNGNSTYLNKAVYNYSGLGPDEIKNGGWEKIIHPDDLETTLTKWAFAIKTGKEYEVEHRFKRYDGSYRWHHCRAVTLLDEDGAVQMWVGISTDIHDRKVMADELEIKVLERTTELQRINKELIKQNEFVESVLETSLVMITVFDTNEEIMVFNKKCEQVFGVEKELVLGKKYTEVFPQAKETLSHTSLQRAIKGETIHNRQYKSTVNNCFYESYLVPLKNAEGVYAVLMTAHDITDIVQVTEQLKKSNEELIHSNGELEQFAYVASHDLQEPLRKIKVFNGLLRESLPLESEIQQKYLNKITHSADRMSDLISDILNFSKLSKSDIDFEEVNLNVIYEKIIEDFEMVINQKTAKMSSEILPTLPASRLQISQLFFNLIGNALKFSKEGISPSIAITTSLLKPEEIVNHNLEKSTEYVIITVTDNGIGFDAKYAEQIFTIFNRLHGKNVYDGSGIGLALCKKIAQRHNGKITVDSQPGIGSSFNVILPRTQRSNRHIAI